MENEDTANGERRKAIERGLKRIQNERITKGGGGKLKIIYVLAETKILWEFHFWF
jgi:hypothetical protein